VRHSVRIGSGAGFSGDRIEPAIVLAQQGGLDYLVFECLAERTIAIAQQQKLVDHRLGYDPFLQDRMRAVLATCFRHHIKIITNMGAANPPGAVDKVVEIGKEAGLIGLKVGAVYGDDVFAMLNWEQLPLLETPQYAGAIKDKAVSANAYLGCEGIVEALNGGADVVITGRVADPSLFLAPMMKEFGWAPDAWDILGKGTVIGHLLECAGQVTGGYFADPGYKDVPDLANLGYPIAEVFPDGRAIITKVPGTGGILSLDTCKEQLLYEIGDPSKYVTPDVIADFSRVHFEQLETDKVLVSGGGGEARTDYYKVSIGYIDGFMGEGQISYGGSTALARARLADRLVRERLGMRGLDTEMLHSSFIGYNSIARILPLSVPTFMPTEVRLRVVGHVPSMSDAYMIGEEIESLYTNGPSGGGGVSKSVRQVLAIVSALVRRTEIKPKVYFERVNP